MQHITQNTIYKVSPDKIILDYILNIDFCFSRNMLVLQITLFCPNANSGHLTNWIYYSKQKHFFLKNIPPLFCQPPPLLWSPPVGSSPHSRQQRNSLGGCNLSKTFKRGCSLSKTVKRGCSLSKTFSENVTFRQLKLSVLVINRNFSLFIIFSGLPFSTKGEKKIGS